MNALDKAIISPPRIPPISASEIPARWLHQVRGVIVRDNLKLRAGIPACIEIRGPDQYQPLNLPNNGIEFVGKRDRDQVLAWLNGSQELPEILE